MASIKVSVSKSDLAKITKKLDSFSKEKSQAIKDQVAISALNIQATAKQLAPVDTGRLRASIDATIGADSLKAEVGTDVEYSASIEFGTSKMAAQPYLFPAAEAERASFIKGITDILKKV